MLTSPLLTPLRGMFYCYHDKTLILATSSKLRQDLGQAKLIALSKTGNDFVFDIQQEISLQPTFYRHLNDSQTQ